MDGSSPVARRVPPTSPGLLERAYAELRRLAQSHMAREAPGHTLQPTALVHEVYLRLLDDERPPWDDRGRLFAAAALAMRRILVEGARRRHTLRRGGDRERVPLDPELAVSAPAGDARLLDLDGALTRLAAVDPRMAQVVELRYFGGLTVEETASVVGVAPRTVRREWEAARLWLYRRIALEERGQSSAS